MNESFADPPTNRSRWRKVVGAVGWFVTFAAIYSVARALARIALDVVGISTTAIPSSSGDPENPPGQLGAILVAAAAAVGGSLVLRRWILVGATSTKRLTSSMRRPAVGVLVMALVATSAALRPRVDAIEDDALRADLIGQAKERGLTDEQASCLVDGSEDGADPGTGPQSLADVVGCLGAAVGDDECLVDALSEITGADGRDARALVEAEARLDASDRERIAQAGLRCQGASEEVAVCLTTGMRREFGEDVFAPRAGPELSDAQRTRVDEMRSECTTSALPPEPATAVAATTCSSYARSLGAAWQSAAPARFAPAATAHAVAIALERSAPDAPPELAGDVATIVAAARGNADALQEKHGSAMTDEASVAAYRLASLELDAQLRIWAACPDLDAELGSGGIDFADMVFAVGGSQADMEEPLFACIQSSRATKPGDDPGCDRLVEACESGGLEACDDIFVWSDPDSAYETIGASCGGRLEDDDDLYGRGACDVIDD